MIHEKLLKNILMAAAICLVWGDVRAQGKKEIPPAPNYSVHRATSEVHIDGILDEDAWEDAVVIPIKYEWQPGDNVEPPVKTDCMVMFDSNWIYIGIRAYDPKVEEIRAHLMDRDSIATFIQDDHVGVTVDPFNDQRRGFQLRVNPLGVQADAIFSDLEGIEDWSWDIIWDSKGRITQNGYEVELAVPFNQIRFPRTTDVQTWGIEFFRSWPRSVRYRMSSRPTDRSKNCVLCQENRITGLEGMKPGKNLEFDPTMTAVHTDNRPQFPDGDLEAQDTDAHPGLTARWGITPNMTLNGAVNPDFSQVEADVAQLDVNTRFALFFPEKRPFFLEGVDIFSTPLDTTTTGAIFTRTVVDPLWGVKVSGKEGKNGIGVFLTRDEINNFIIPSNQFSSFASLDQDVTGTVLRYRRDVFRNSTVGALYAGREANGYHNRYFGFDGFMRLSNSDTFNFLALRSNTLYPQNIATAYGQSQEEFEDEAFVARYSHVDRNWIWQAWYDDLGEGFRADSGFIPRVDTRRARGLLQRRLFGDGRWYTQLNFGGVFEYIEDHNGRLTDQIIRWFANFSGPLQSYIATNISRNKEYFNGITYDITRGDLYAELKPSGSSAFQFYGQIGDEIDFANSQPADGVFLNPSVELKISRPINFQFNHTYQRLNVAGGRLFTANLSQFRIVYQFNIRTFVRAILQYERISRNQDLYSFPVEAETDSLFTQFLFSYKINPQSVIFVGYSDNHLGLDRIDLIQTDRTFFLKIGYAFLF
jgi:hypothetical protein